MCTNMASKEERYSPTPHDDERSRGRSRSRSPVCRSRSRSGSLDDKKESRIITSKRLYISNIPYDMKWKDIKDMFRKTVGDCYVSMYEAPDGKSRGAGIIEFRDIVKAQEAADKMHRFEVNGRKIIVREETDRDRRRHQHDIKGESGGGGGYGGNFGGGMGLIQNSQPALMGSSNANAAVANVLSSLAPQLLQQLGINDPSQITNQVFVANLDYRVTWKKLREVYSMAGNVVRAEIMQDSEGKSRGLATVTYENPLEALQAISMFNNQTLYDRTMSVKMDKMAEMVQPKVPLPSGLKSIGTGLNLSQLAGDNFSSRHGGFSVPGGGAGLLNNLIGGGAGIGSLGQGLMNASSGFPGGLGSFGGLALNQGIGGMMGDTGGYNGGGGGGSSCQNYGTGYSNLQGGGLGNLDLTNLANLAANLNTDLGVGLSNMINSLGGGGLSGGGGGGSLGPSNGILSSRGGYADGDRGNGSGGSMRRDDRRSTSHASTRGQANLTSRNDECTSVFVRNLPFSFTWQTLKETFKAAGDVQYAEIKRDQDNKSRGCGIVRFSSGQEAKRAINLLNGTKVNGRDIEVRLDAQQSSTRSY